MGRSTTSLNTPRSDRSERAGWPSWLPGIGLFRQRQPRAFRADLERALPLFAATSILRGTTLLGARTEACMSYMKRERSAGYKVIEDIAKQHLGLSTLETRRSDSLDFHDLAVWQLRAALEAAYRAGAATKKEKQR